MFSNRLRLTVLDAYLFQQALLTILFGLILFTIIWLAPETLYKLIQYTFAGRISFIQALWMFLFHVPGVMQTTIPLAAFLGAIFLFRRLSLTLEWVAMMSGGISPARILVPIAAAGLCFTMLHAMVQEYVTPLTGPRLDALYRKTGIKNIKDQNFVYVEKNHRGVPQRFFLIGQTKQKPFTDFLILFYQPDQRGGIGIAKILKAKTGIWDPQHQAWHLSNGTGYQLDADGVYQQSSPFQEEWVPSSPHPAELLTYRNKDPLDMNRSTLERYVKLLKAGSQLQEVPFYQVRLTQKITAPLASLVFVILGSLMGVEKARSNSNLGLTFGAIILFVYCVLLPFTVKLVSLGIVAPWLAAWVPMFVSILLSIGLLRLKSVFN